MAGQKKGKKPAAPVAGSRAATRRRGAAKKRAQAKAAARAEAQAAAVPDPWGVVVYAETGDDPGNPAEYVEGLYPSRASAEAAADALTAAIQDDADYLYGSADAYPVWAGPTPAVRAKLVRRDRGYRAGLGATGPDGAERVWACPAAEGAAERIGPAAGRSRVVQLSDEPVAWRAGE